MPLKRVKNKVFHKVGGKWKLKATAKSAEKAKKYVKAVYANRRK
jgi:hypothetical protein